MASRAASTHFVQFCIQWSSIALLYYDYVLTFGMEVKYIWGQKFRISTALYVCCRYALVANVIYLLTIANKITIKVCHAGFIISGTLSVFGRGAIVMVWGARTYAVFGRSRLVLAFFGTIGLIVIILDIIGVPTTQCKGSNSIPIAGGVLAIMTVVFEVSSAGLTTFRSIQALNVGGPWRTQKEGFMYLLFEQGLLYFCVVSVLTVASLALNVSIPGGFLQRLLNAYTIPLSGLMTARFLLHLRMWESKHAAFRSRPRNRVDEDCDEDEDSTGMDFVSNPNHQRSRTVTLDSFVEDFGEDPVRRARASSINFSRSGGGVTQDGLAG